MGESGIAQANRLVGQYRGATLALREHKGMEEVHAYRIAARRLLALLALWRPLIHEPELERRLTRAVGTLSALRDAQVYAQHHGGSLRQNRLPRVPLLTGPLARWLARLEEVPVGVDLLPLFQLHLALSLSEALAKTSSLPVGIRAKLRCWHRLRLVLKQARLGQLQDRRQWLRRLRGETGRGQQRRALKTEIRCQLLQLDCHQAELVGLRMALLQSGQ